MLCGLEQILSPVCGGFLKQKGNNGCRVDVRGLTEKPLSRADGNGHDRLGIIT